MKKIAVALVIAAALLAAPGFAAIPSNMEKVVMVRPGLPSKGASDVVRSFYASLVAAMQEGKSFQARFDKLQPALDRAFNMQDMMRVAAGPSWVKASPEQQSKLINAFRSFSVANYASQFKSYNDEKFEIRAEKPGAQDGDRVVETVLTSGGEAHELNYLMRKSGKGWQIVDVYLNGTISEIASRRSEFSGVMREQGPDALQQMLEQKSQALANS